MKARRKSPKRRDPSSVNPQLTPFLNEVALMLAERLLCDQRKGKRGSTSVAACAGKVSRVTPGDDLPVQSNCNGVAP